MTLPSIKSVHEAQMLAVMKILAQEIPEIIAPALERSGMVFLPHRKSLELFATAIITAYEAAYQVSAEEVAATAHCWTDKPDVTDLENAHEELTAAHKARTEDA